MAQWSKALALGARITAGSNPVYPTKSFIMIVKCDKCGKEFEKSDKRAKESLKRGWKMFCSDECKKSYKTKKVICECVNCGKRFERMLSQIRGATFCSIIAAIFIPLICDEILLIFSINVVIAIAVKMP